MTTSAIRRPRARHAMFLPAAALMAWGVLAAAGFPMAPSSHAASAGSTTVSATVQPVLTIGGTCPGGNLNSKFGAGGFLPSIAGSTSLGTCTVTATTNNNAAGTYLRVKSARAVGSPTFCTNATTTVACGGGTSSFGDTTAAGGAATIADGQFAIQVSGAPTCTTPTWTTNNFYPLLPSAASGATICNAAMNATSSYTLDFTADPSATQPAGNYYAQADFVVEAS